MSAGTCPSSPHHYPPDRLPATYLVRRLVWRTHFAYFDGDFATAVRPSWAS